MRRRVNLLAMLVLSSMTAWPVVGEQPPVTVPDARAERLSRLQGSASLGRNRQVSGATILVRRVAGDGPVFVTSTDHRGLFEVDGLADGRYRVELRRDGLETVVKESVDLEFPARPVVEVIMKPQVAAELSPQRMEPLPGDAVDVSLSGRIEVRDGGTLASAELRLRRLDGSRDPISLRSNADGSFFLSSLASGAWRLYARVPGYHSLRTPLIVAEDTVLEISLVAQSAGYKPSPLELMPRERVVPPEPLP